MFKINKNKLFQILFLLVIGIIIASYNFQDNAFAYDIKNDCKFKFGVISDIHLGDDQDFQRQQNLRKALIYYKKNDIKVLIVNGDIVDKAKVDGYKKFNKIFNDIYPDAKTAPKKILIMDNHEYYDSWHWEKDVPHNTIEVLQQRFKENMGVDDINTHIIINGYHFIGLSSDGMDVLYKDTTKMWLKQQLSDAMKDDPNKAIFVAFHQPVYGTLYGSNEDKKDLDCILKDYPQVISFSGHLHEPLQEERNIYQKDYTCVSDGVLYYFVTDTISHFNCNAAQCILVSVDNKSVDIERHDIEHNEKIKNDWIINLPNNDKTKFTYTDDRVKNRKAPYFDSNSKIVVSNLAASSCDMDFNSAKNDDFVRSYEIKVVDDSSGKIVKDDIKNSDFYMGITRMSQVQRYSIKDLKPNRIYRIYVYAIESYGKKSIPITEIIKTLAE